MSSYSRFLDKQALERNLARIKAEYVDMPVLPRGYLSEAMHGLARGGMQAVGGVLGAREVGQTLFEDALLPSVTPSGAPVRDTVRQMREADYEQASAHPTLTKPEWWMQKAEELHGATGQPSPDASFGEMISNPKWWVAGVSSMLPISLAAAVTSVAGTPALGFAGIAAVEGGAQWNEGKAKGVDPSANALASVAVGFTNSLLEMAPMGMWAKRIRPGLGVKTIKARAVRRVVDALKKKTKFGRYAAQQVAYEAITEGAQEITSIVADSVAHDLHITTEEFWKRVGGSAALAAAGAGPFVGVAGVVERSRQGPAKGVVMPPETFQENPIILKQAKAKTAALGVIEEALAKEAPVKKDVSKKGSEGRVALFKERQALREAKLAEGVEAEQAKRQQATKGSLPDRLYFVSPIGENIYESGVVGNEEGLTFFTNANDAEVYANDIRRLIVAAKESPEAFQSTMESIVAERSVGEQRAPILDNVDALRAVDPSAVIPIEFSKKALPEGTAFEHDPISGLVTVKAGVSIAMDAIDLPPLEQDVGGDVRGLKGAVLRRIDKMIASSKDDAELHRNVTEYGIVNRAMDTTTTQNVIEHYKRSLGPKSEVVAKALSSIVPAAELVKPLKRAPGKINHGKVLTTYNGVMRELLDTKSRSGANEVLAKAKLSMRERVELAHLLWEHVYTTLDPAVHAFVGPLSLPLQIEGYISPNFPRITPGSEIPLRTKFGVRGAMERVLMEEAGVGYHDAKAFTSLLDEWAGARGETFDEYVRRRLTPLDIAKGYSHIGGVGEKVASGRFRSSLTLRAIEVGKKAPTLSVLLHEFGHIIQAELTVRELAIIEPLLSAEKNCEAHNGIWNPEAIEKFADTFSEYFNTGECPTSELRGVFEHVRRVLRALSGYIWHYTEIDMKPQWSAIMADLFEPTTDFEYVSTPKRETMPMFSSEGGNKRLKAKAAKRQRLSDLADARADVAGLIKEGKPTGKYRQLAKRATSGRVSSTKNMTVDELAMFLTALRNARIPDAVRKAAAELGVDFSKVRASKGSSGALAVKDVLRAVKRVEQEGRRDDGMGSIEALKAAKEPTRADSPSHSDPTSVLGAVGKNIRNYNAAQRRMYRFFRWLDGGKDGFMVNLFWRPIKEARYAEAIDVHEKEAAMQAAIVKHQITWDTLVQPRAEHNGVGWDLQSLIWLDTISHDKGNLFRLMHCMELKSISEIGELIGKLKPNERAFATWLRGQYAARYKDVAPVYFNKTGKTLTNISGQVHIDYESKNLESLTMELFEGQLTRTEQGGVGEGSTKDRADILKELKTDEDVEEMLKRVEGKGRRVSMNPLANYLRYISSTSHYINFAEAYTDLHGIVHDEEFKHAFKQRFTDWEYKAFVEWFQDTFKTGPTGSKLASNWLDKARHNASVALIGWNVWSALRQRLSLPTAIADDVKQGHVYIIPAFCKAFKPSNYAMMKKFVHEKAEHIRYRFVERDIKGIAANELAALKTLVSGKTGWRQKAFAFLRWNDQQAVVPIWYGAYNYAIAELGLSEQEAINHANGLIERTQPMADPEDLPPAFRGNTAMKLFTTFQNMVNQNRGVWAEDIGKVRKGDIGKMEFALKVMWNLAVPGLLMGFTFRGGVPPKDKKEYLVDLLTYPMSSFLVIGPIAVGAIKGYSSSIPPGIMPLVDIPRALQQGKKVMKARAEGKESTAYVKSTAYFTAKAATSLMGIPFTQPYRTAGGLVNFFNGDQDLTYKLLRLIASEHALSKTRKKEERRAKVNRASVRRRRR